MDARDGIVEEVIEVVVGRVGRLPRGEVAGRFNSYGVRFDDGVVRGVEVAAAAGLGS